MFSESQHIHNYFTRFLSFSLFLILSQSSIRSLLLAHSCHFRSTHISNSHFWKVQFAFSHGSNDFRFSLTQTCVVVAPKMRARQKPWWYLHLNENDVLHSHDQKAHKRQEVKLKLKSKWDFRQQWLLFEMYDSLVFSILCE